MSSTNSISSVICFICAAVAVAVSAVGGQKSHILSKHESSIQMVCPIVNALAGRLLDVYDLGVATPRALVHAGDKTSGDASTIVQLFEILAQRLSFLQTYELTNIIVDVFEYHFQVKNDLPLIPTFIASEGSLIVSSSRNPIVSSQVTNPIAVCSLYSARAIVVQLAFLLCVVVEFSLVFSCLSAKMTRSPGAQQRRRNKLQAAMTAATGNFNVITTMVRWFMLGSLIINRLIESKMLRKKYMMSFNTRRDNMWSMVYQSDITSVVNVRMNKIAFSKLCNLLETRGGLCNSKHMLVDEQVAMFLHTLAHNEKNRIIVNRFQRSGETISRYFKLVLNAVCRLHKDFYKTPVRVPDNETDERWKWFKGCLGALDDLMFSYVLAGWEGSAADSRVLRDAISRPNGLKVTRGSYYLCDAGYTNGDGFLTPYRGQRYHLNDWSHPPTTAKELYNMKHSSARNVIERCFEMSQDPLDNEVPMDHTQDGNEHDNVISTVETSQGWSDRRDNLANDMFNEWNITHGN
ncbi:ALP1-like protein [Tanacetum coccineum]